MNFNASIFEFELAEKIADRALALAGAQGVAISKSDMVMDIVATHVNGCSLRLDELLRANEFEFTHDVFGIRRHLDRRTGKLGDCFTPRFAIVPELFLGEFHE